MKPYKNLENNNIKHVMFLLLINTACPIIPKYDEKPEKSKTYGSASGSIDSEVSQYLI